MVGGSQDFPEASHYAETQLHLKSIFMCQYVHPVDSGEVLVVDVLHRVFRVSLHTLQDNVILEVGDLNLKQYYPVVALYHHTRLVVVER